MFSQTAEYALRTVVFLGTLRNRPATTSQIAAATQVPIGYLFKILNSLVRAGIVSSQRGPGGGSVLARSPAKLTVFEVVTAIAPLPRIHTCPLGLASHGIRLCPLHRKLDDAMATVEQAFRQSRIAAGGADDQHPAGRLRVRLESRHSRGRDRISRRTTRHADGSQAGYRDKGEEKVASSFQRGVT